MQLPPDSQLQVRLQRWSGYLTITMIVMSLLVLLGWYYSITLFKDPFATTVPMNPVSAVCFILAGLSLWLFKNTPYRKIAWIAAAAILLVGLLKFGSLAFGFDVPIDSFLFTEKLVGAKASDLPNRMAFNTSFCFILTGASLLFVSQKNSRIQKTSHYLALAIVLAGLLSLLGYLYRVQSFYGFLTYIPMSASTAVCFFLFALSLLFADPGKGIMKEFTSTLSGSLMGRFFIPAAFIIPAVLGLLRLY